MGKTLHARSRIAVYDVPRDDGRKVIRHVQAGQPIGIVVSYVDFNPVFPRYRDHGYWGLAGNAGWVSWLDYNKIAVNTLVQQGAQTPQQILEAQQQADQSMWQQATSAASSAADAVTSTTNTLVTGAVVVAAFIIFSKFNSK